MPGLMLRQESQSFEGQSGDCRQSGHAPYDYRVSNVSFNAQREVDFGYLESDNSNNLSRVIKWRSTGNYRYIDCVARRERFGVGSLHTVHRDSILSQGNRGIVFALPVLQPGAVFTFLGIEYDCERLAGADRLLQRDVLLGSVLRSVVQADRHGVELVRFDLDDAPVGGCRAGGGHRHGVPAYQTSK